MEGISRVPMLVAEIKVSAAELQPEFRTKIKQYIADHYMADPSQFDAAITEIEEIRKRICQYVIDPEALCVMKRYYAQMLMVKMRFPMEENDPVAVPFAWYDRIMEMPTPAVFEDVNFELGCILYNIGTFHASLGAVETRVDLDSIKNAFMHFQLAAWPLKYMRDEMNLGKFGTTDFEHSILTWYINLYLNQAQECLLEKSMIDHKKPLTVATIAFFLQNSYRCCRKHLDESSVGEVVSSSRFKEWVRTCSVKSNLYGAIGHLYLGMKADEEKKWGVRVAHYNLALDFIKAAEKDGKNDKRESMKQSLIFAFEVIVGKQKNAAKENDFIYHERIPKFEDLEIPSGKLLTKPIAFDPQDRSVLGDDLFSQLLPVSVIRAVSVYEEEKTNLKRKIEDRVNKKNDELEEYFRALNLDEINVDTEPDKMTLPEDLLAANAAFSAQPEAFAEILNKLHELGNRSREAESKLNELKVRLDAIDLPEITGDKGYEVISGTLEKRLEIFNQNRDKDTNLQSIIADESEHIRTLSMPISELKKTIISIAPKLDESDNGRKLKRILDKVDEMRLQRIQLLDSLRMDISNDDIRGRLLAEKHEDNTDLFAKELGKHDKQIAVIDQNLAAQENILNALTDANAQYSTVRQQSVELAQKRMNQILALVNAYDVFKDVNEKAGAGINFYSQLLAESVKLEPSISGMEMHCQKVKKEQQEKQREMEEKMREIHMKAETSDTMALFGYGSQQNEPVVPPVTARRDRASKDRPRIDFMEFYRNKMAEMSGGSALPPGPSRVAPSPRLPPQGGVPVAPAGYGAPRAVPSTRSLAALRQQLATGGPSAGAAASFAPSVVLPQATAGNFVNPGQAIPGATPYQLPIVPPPVSPSGSSISTRMSSPCQPQHGNDFQQGMNSVQVAGQFPGNQLRSQHMPSGYPGASPSVFAPTVSQPAAPSQSQPMMQSQYLPTPSGPSVPSSYSSATSSSYPQFGPSAIQTSTVAAQMPPQQVQFSGYPSASQAVPNQASTANAYHGYPAQFGAGQPGMPTPGSGASTQYSQPPFMVAASTATCPIPSQPPTQASTVPVPSIATGNVGIPPSHNAPFMGLPGHPSAVPPIAPTVTSTVSGIPQPQGAPYPQGAQTVQSRQFTPVLNGQQSSLPAARNVTPSVQGAILSGMYSSAGNVAMQGFRSPFAPNVQFGSPLNSGLSTPVRSYNEVASPAPLQQNVQPAQASQLPSQPVQANSASSTPRPQLNQLNNPSTRSATPVNPQLGRPQIPPAGMGGFQSPFAPKLNQPNPLLNASGSSPWHKGTPIQFAPLPQVPTQPPIPQHMVPQPSQPTQLAPQVQQPTFSQPSQPVQQPQWRQNTLQPQHHATQPVQSTQWTQPSQPSQPPPPSQSAKFSNVDLLSSLMDDPLGIAHLPAPLVPSQTNTTRVVTALEVPGPTETTQLPPALTPLPTNHLEQPTPTVVTTTQPLQHSAPTPQQIHSECATPQPSVPETPVFDQSAIDVQSKGEPQLRPSASVLPIIQPSQSSSSLQSSEQHTLSMSTVTSVNYVAYPSEKTMDDEAIENGKAMDLNNLMNPTTFDIGSSDETRMQKRLARNQFNNPLPPLDPSDPLNHLDANFFRSKS
ncbi:hypothetical protein QR680_008877 [Steinernema hermaphroditum]|uniref:BRO1 domain-containing protein n=1 Tax=Steinernema hermaphroditum TaxID=289476 RepID=A0AA39IK44_9BILA|nr:hypothetical protein QR680_008877 [Steinernema hermaphroditum]